MITGNRARPAFWMAVIIPYAVPVWCCSNQGHCGEPRPEDSAASRDNAGTYALHNVGHRRPQGGGEHGVGQALEDEGRVQVGESAVADEGDGGVHADEAAGRHHGQEGAAADTVDGTAQERRQDGRHGVGNAHNERRLVLRIQLGRAVLIVQGAAFAVADELLDDQVLRDVVPWQHAAITVDTRRTHIRRTVRLRARACVTHCACRRT